MTHDRQQWCETAIPGLHVRTGSATAGTRLLGWPGVLPVSVIQSVGLATGKEEPSHRAGVSATGQKKA
ncbi:hypothetical protein [Streptomyces sp. NPDC052727]|uniref:hypothetical protein n=1 Tax=unclassified Streptomyces TaxID=2593676 RepID=UPI0034499DEB